MGKVINMKKGTLLLYDIKYGLLKQIVIYFFAGLTALWGVLEFSNMAFSEYSFFDCYGYLFSGIEFYYFSADSTFIIPIMWLVLQIIPAFLVGYYARNELTGFGQQMIIKSGSRKYWWFSKVIWCLISVVIYYIVIAAIVGIFIIFKSGTFDISLWGFQDVMTLGLMNGEVITEFQIITICILLPFMTTLTMCLFQMVLTFYVQPLYAYMIAIVYCILCVYLPSHLMLGHYSMLVRSEYYSENGMPSIIGLICMFILQIFIVAIGYYRIKNMNILKY